MEKSYCKKCKKNKNVDEFYKSSLSRCKECRKKDTKKNHYSKNEVLCMMDNIYNKLNSMELLHIELNKKYDKLIFSLNLNKENKQEDDIIKTLNNIHLHE